MDKLENLIIEKSKENIEKKEKLSDHYINEIMRVTNLSQGKEMKPLMSYEEKCQVKIEELSNKKLINDIKELDSKIIAINQVIEKINSFEGSYQERNELEEELLMAVEHALRCLYKKDPLQNQHIEAFKNNYFFRKSYFFRQKGKGPDVSLEQ